jgi:peptidoglycan/xylan/chitin deacetylase (PgdA/CDA1 family)
MPGAFRAVIGSEMTEVIRRVARTDESSGSHRTEGEKAALLSGTSGPAVSYASAFLGLVAASTAGGLGALIGCRHAAMRSRSQIFGRTILGGSDRNEIALTFDDGPNVTWTEQILQTLAQHNVRATFFMIGAYVRQRPDLVRAVRDAGHIIGNHTMNHLKLVYCSPRTVRNELYACNAILEDTLSQKVRYFRPPFGARRPDVLLAARELGLLPVMWNALGRDWEDLAPEQIASNVDAGIERNRRRGEGSNVLMHDGGPRTMGTNRARTLRAVALLLARYEVTHRFVTIDAFCPAVIATPRGN